MGKINYVSINDKLITVEAVYHGDKDWPANPSRQNYHNYAVYVSSDAGEAEFEVWGSIAYPRCFEEDNDGPYQVLYLVCSDALTYLYDEIREIIDPNLEYEEYEEEYNRLEKAMFESYNKLSDVGLSEDEILKMANSETEYEVIEEDGKEIFVPMG